MGKKKPTNKVRKENKGTDITDQILGTRVLAGIACSSRGQDSSAVSVVNRNSSCNTAQALQTDNSKESFDNRVLPETDKTSIDKEASLALPEERNDTPDATALINLETNKSQSKSCNTHEIEATQTALDTKLTGQETIDKAVPVEGTLPESETENANIRKEASSALLEKGKETPDTTSVTNLESNESQIKSCNKDEIEASETTLDTKITGQKIIDRAVPVDGTLPDTKANMRKEASSAFTEEGKDTLNPSAVIDQESNEYESKSSNTTQMKAFETVLENRSKGNETMEKTIKTDGTIPETRTVSVGTQTCSELTQEKEQPKHPESKRTASQVEISLIAPSADPEIWSWPFGFVRFILPAEKTLTGIIR